MMLFWAMLQLTGCMQTLEAPEFIELPDRVEPLGEFSVEVSKDEGATLTFWWSVDGEHHSQFTGPTVNQEVKTEGEAWTVIVRQSLDGVHSPPAHAEIPIYEGGLIDQGCRPGSSADCLATDCADVLEGGLDTDGLYWFEPTDSLSGPYKAQCAFDDDEAWMRVMTINDGSESWDADSWFWDVSCEDLPVGAESKGIADWDTTSGFDNSGINPGACAIPVEKLRLCPHSGTGDHFCYESPDVKNPGLTLREAWSAETELLEFEDVGGMAPSMTDGDFLMRCAEPQGGGSGEPSTSISWMVGHSSPRIGFSGFFFGYELFYGIGYDPVHRMNAGFYVSDMDTDCSGAASVWVQ